MSISRPYAALSSFALLLCLACWPAAAQTGASIMNGYLFADTDVLQDQLMAHLPQPPTNHWLDEPELRVTPEVDTRELWTQTYSLRFRPRNRRQRRSERALFDVERARDVADWERRLGPTLAARYHSLIDLAALEVRYSLAANRLELERSAFAADQVVAVGAADASARLHNTALRLELLELGKRQLERRIKRLRGETIAGHLRVTNTDRPELSPRLIRPQTIGMALDVIAADASAMSPDGKLAQLDLKRARHELDLFESRSGFGLNLVEISYENKGIDSRNITVGFRLPFGRRTYRNQRLLGEVRAAEENARLTELAVLESVQSDVRQIRWRIEEYAGQNRALADIGSRLQQVSGDAVAFAAIRKHQLELLDSAATTHSRLLHDYIELLDLAGLLQRPPLTNWIDGDSR